MKPLAKLPRVLQPAKRFNTRRTRQTLTLTRQNPYPSLRVRVLWVRVWVAPENPRVTRANHYEHPSSFACVCQHQVNTTLNQSFPIFLSAYLSSLGVFVFQPSYFQSVFH